MSRGITICVLVLLAIAALVCGCGKPGSELAGQWQSPKENAQINIERNGEAFIVEIVQDGKSSKFPGTYKDGTLTIQNLWVTVSFYRDDKTGELVANSGGEEERLKRK